MSEGCRRDVGGMSEGASDVGGITYVKGDVGGMSEVTSDIALRCRRDVGGDLRHIT